MACPIAFVFGVTCNLGALWTLPAEGTGPQFPDAPATPQSVRTDSPDRLVRLITFSPSRSDAAVERLAREFHRRYGGSVDAQRQFVSARLSGFRSMVARYGMDPNDLATAHAFAIVAGYRAYNGARLSDSVSGRILFGLLAVQSVVQQQDRPWSNAQKQEAYETIGAEASAVNWSLERALQHRDQRSFAAVRSRAREMLRRELGRDPDGITPDTYACVAYRSAPCGELIHELRGAFETVSAER